MAEYLLLCALPTDPMVAAKIPAAPPHRQQRPLAAIASQSLVGNKAYALLPLVAEVCSEESLFQVVKRPNVFNNIPARIVEKNLPFLITANRDEPL